MSQNEENYYEEVSFNSFLAGVLLTRRVVSFRELRDLENSFVNMYNVKISGLDNLIVRVVFEGENIRLVNDYNDVINVNGKLITVSDYLFLNASTSLMTSSRRTTLSGQLL